MKTISFTIAAFAAAAIALPASADQRGHGRYKGGPAVDLSAQVLSKSKHRGSVAEVDATIRGIADVDLDVLSRSKHRSSILDLDATLGSKKNPILDLDLTLAGKKRGRGGHDYDFGGGVGY